MNPDPVPAGIRLSICVTTRNRAEFLRQTLDSILPQVTEEVEIVIIDGASTDHTGDVAREFQRNCSRLRYFRMAKNSGVDRDYNTSVESARGEYCWFMSDDDLLKPGAVRTVLDETSKGYCVLVVNAEDWNFDFSERLKERRLLFDHNRVYAPSELDRFFIETAYHLSFIPALVIRRDIWMSRERDRYFGSWFAHVGVVFQQPLPNDAILIADPLIRIRNDNISWRENIFEIWMFHWLGLIRSFESLDNSLKEKIGHENPMKDWRILLAYRAMGSYSYKEYKKFILPAGYDCSYRVISALISIVPPSFVKIMVRFYHRLVKNK
jgi:abequosyltransferase